MINAIYCTPLIFFSLLWLANLFLKKGFYKIESQYYSPFTPVKHVKVRSPLLFFQQLKLLSFSCSPLTTADPPFWPVLYKFLQNTFARSILSLCHCTQLVFLLSRFYANPYKFTFWSCLLHLPYTFFPLQLVLG